MDRDPVDGVDASISEGVGGLVALQEPVHEFLGRHVRVLYLAQRETVRDLGDGGEHSLDRRVVEPLAAKQPVQRLR